MKNQLQQKLIERWQTADGYLAWVRLAEVLAQIWLRRAMRRPNSPLAGDLRVLADLALYRAEDYIPKEKAA